MMSDGTLHLIRTVRRTMSILLVLSLALCVVSCSSSRQLRRDVTIQNGSTNHLEWVDVDWGGHTIDVGVLPPGKGATILDAGIPAGVTTNIAVLKFINEDQPGLNWESGSNDEVRARRAKSWTRVPVDVSPLLKLGPGPCHITFRILSVTNAEVVVEGM